MRQNGETRRIVEKMAPRNRASRTMAKLRSTMAALFALALAMTAADARSGRPEPTPFYAEFVQLLTVSRAKQWNELAVRAPPLVTAMEAANQTGSVGYSRILEFAAFGLMYTGHRDEAEPYLKKALAWQQTAYGPVSDAYFKQLENFAELYLAVGRPEDAERLYRDCE